MIFDCNSSLSLLILSFTKSYCIFFYILVNLGFEELKEEHNDAGVY